MIDFSLATVLSLNYTPQFLGDNLRYKVTQNLSIEGWILSSTFSGVSGIQSGINYLLSNPKDYDEIVLNGYNFGQGKVLDFQFDKDEQTRDVLYKKYTASLEVYSSGNLFNAVSGYYSGLTWENAQILDRFDESFSYTRNQDGSSQYSQQLNLRFNSGQSLPDTPLNLAKAFASGFIANTNITGFLGSDYSKNFHKYFTENINLIDSTYSVKYDVQFPIESGIYAINYNHSYSLDENGIINVSENGNIKGLYDPLMQGVHSGLAIEIPNSWARCSGLFAFYSPSGAYPLNPNPVKKNIKVNRFEGTADFEIAYTDDPRYQNTYVWEYTTTIDVSTQRVYTVTENGKVDGIGRRLLNKYPNALSGFNIVESGISARVSGIYDSVNPYPLNLNLTDSKVAYSYYQGAITYTQTFSDNITLFPTSGIRQFEFKISDKIPTQATNKFNILGVKELIQPTNQSTLGQRNIDIKMIGNRGLPVSNYLTYASGQLTGFKDIGTDIWTANANYSYDPVNNQFGLNVVYNYDGLYKNFTDIIFSNSGVME